MLGAILGYSLTLYRGCLTVRLFNVENYYQSSAVRQQHPLRCSLFSDRALTLLIIPAGGRSYTWFGFCSVSDLSIPHPLGGI